jgi:hypothetical protein
LPFTAAFYRAYDLAYFNEDNYRLNASIYHI